MIVTRHRRKTIKWKRYALPALAIVLVGFAAWWGPSRNVVVNGPLAPAWQAMAPAANAVAAPFHFAAQDQVITDRNRQIVKLQSQVTTAQSDSQAKDKQIAHLQAQVDQLQTQAANASAQASKGVPAAQSSPLPFGASSGSTNGTAVVSGDLSSNATADMRRTAQYWASMEPDNAAKVIQRLPTPYVARVFSLMTPDAVGAVLDALPPAYAAQLTQEHPELRR